MKNLLSDKPKTEADVLADIGYSKGITETPSIVKNSEGFKLALSQIGLREALIAEGIDSKKIAEKINVLLEAKDGEKTDYTAIDKGLKHATAIFGITEDKPKDNSGNTYNFIFSEEVQGDIKQIEDRIKERLTNHRNVKEN